jgi:hypothetical protein
MKGEKKTKTKKKNKMETKLMLDLANVKSLKSEKEAAGASKRYQKNLKEL